MIRPAFGRDFPYVLRVCNRLVTVAGLTAQPVGRFVVCTLSRFDPLRTKTSAAHRTHLPLGILRAMIVIDTEQTILHKVAARQAAAP